MKMFYAQLRLGESRLQVYVIAESFAEAEQKLSKAFTEKVFEIKIWGLVDPLDSSIFHYKP